MGTAQLIAIPTCGHCGGDNVKMRRQIIANGGSQFAWRCLDCDRWAEKPPKWIKHEEVEVLLKRYHKTLDDILTVEDYSNLQPCVVCGEPGEVHHWAPQALESEFGADWYKWPTAPLCLRHHLLWHKVITPTLSERRSRE